MSLAYTTTIKAVTFYQKRAAHVMWTSTFEVVSQKKRTNASSIF